MITLDKTVSLSSYGRVIAILMIVIFHLFDSIQKADPSAFHHLIFKATHFGSQGIHFFFFISAFFLYLKYEHISKYNTVFFNWLKKRLLKLYPTYIASIIIIICLFYIFSSQVISLKEILINLTPIFRNLDEHYIHSINGNFWFLHTLIEFYLIFPILVLLINKMTNLKFLVLTYVIVLLYIVSYTYYFSVDSTKLNPYTAFFINYLYDFSLGMVLAKYLKTHKYIKFNFIYIVSIFLLFEGIGVYLSQISAFGRNINDIFFSIASIMFIFVFSYILTFILNEIKKSNNYLTKTINFLSTKVYDIYLVHHPVIKITLTQISTYSTINFVIVFLIIFPIALFNYYISKLIIKAFSWKN